MCLFSLPNADMRSSVLVQGNEGCRCSFDVCSVQCTAKGWRLLVALDEHVAMRAGTGRIAVCSLVPSSV